MTKKRSSYPWSQSLQVRVKEEALALLSLLQALLEPSRRFGGVFPNLVPVLPLLVLALSSLCLLEAARLFGHALAVGEKLSYQMIRKAADRAR